MTPKEKAIALVEKFKPHAYQADHVDVESQDLTYNAKACAIICVDEILKIYDGRVWSKEQQLKFWNDVKTEIQNL